MSVVTRAPNKLRPSVIATNKVNSSLCQSTEKQIDAPKNPPTPDPNGLRSGNTWEAQHPPALRVAGRRFPLLPCPIKGSGSRQFNIPITLQTLDDLRSFSIGATLVDSGVTDVGVIDAKYVADHQINTYPVAKPIIPANADGSLNAEGAIKHFVPFRMKVGNHEETINLLVTKLSSNHVFLGHEWLSLHDPEISWRKKTLRFTRCSSECFTNMSMCSIDSRPNYYAEFPHVFSPEEFQSLPPSRPWDHSINLVDGSHEINEKLYSLTRQERAQLDEWLDENLKSGRIRPSTSRYASPCFFRHDPKTRLCHDYRKLNSITIKDRYPLPRIRDLIDRLQGAKHFSKMDVRWGFNNVRIKEGDEYKAAFITHRGLFEPLVMQFGLCNAPATFQRMMNEIFQEEIRTGKVVIYIDDILVFTADMDEHRKLVRMILHRLQENNLFLKPEKCEFETTKTQFLRMIIEPGTTHMAPKKVSAVLNWPAPHSKRELQRFLGLTNYYRRFIQGFAETARPLHYLTGAVPWKWTHDQDRAFTRLKQALTSAPTLAMPDEERPFRVETDASDFAIGAVLSQKGPDNIWHPVEFYSRSMSPAERNYQIYDKEMLAVREALLEWRQYLLSANSPTEVWSDHLNLTYYRKPQNLSKRQARWISDLADYDFTIHHLPGKLNNKADALSR